MERVGRVVIADPDTEAARPIADWLAEAGHEVVACRHDPECPAPCERERPDVLLLVLPRPDAAGWEVLRHLDQRPEPSDVRVAVLIADGPLASEDFALLERRADAVLVQPVRREVLLVQLAALLRLREAHRRLDRQAAMLARTERLAGVGSWEWEIGADRVTWSEQLYRIFGLDPASPPPTFAEHETLCGARDMARLRAVVEKAVSDGTPYEISLDARRPDGTVRRCVGRGFAERDPDGRVVRLAGSFRDVSELERALAALSESQAMLQAAMDQSPAGIAVADAPDGRLRYVNEAGLVIRGLDPDAPIGDVTAEDYPRAWQIRHLDGRLYRTEEVPLARAVLFGETCQAEFLVQRDDGEERFVLARATPIRDATGRLTAGIVVFLDITERREAEKRAESLARFPAENPSPVLRVSREGTLVYANAAAKVVLDAWGARIGQALPRLWCQRVAEAFERGAPIRHGLELGGASYGVTVAPIVDGGYVNLYMVDETAQLRALAALRSSEERYRLLAESSVDVIWRADLDLVLTYVSPAVERLLGDRPEDWLGTSLADHFSPDEFSRFGEVLAGQLAGPEDPAGVMIEWVLRHRDGSDVPVEVHAALLRDADGTPVGVQGATRGIAERLRLERERDRLEDQLRQAQKLESIGRLAGGVAHDFNNMLQIILGHAVLSLESLEPGHPLGRDLEEIRTAAERSAELTNQLLAFARRQAIQPQVLDLDDKVASMLKMLRRLIGEDVALVWKPNPSTGPVEIDPGQLDQVLANLVVNARDAIEGPGTITIETAPFEVDGAGPTHRPDLPPGSYARLSVRDDGAGMDERTMSQIFEPFFTTKERDEGTGLGLATVYGIVRQNGGLVEVDSRPGCGTTFDLYFPSYAGTVAETAAAPSAVSVGSGVETVLLVEDEASILELVRRILEGQGYRVLAAREPVEALGLARGSDVAIDLMLTDVIMPGMSGKQLWDEVRRDRPNARCVFMSGYTADVIAHEGVLPDGVHFLEKPFTAEGLAKTIRRVLDAAPS